MDPMHWDVNELVRMIGAQQIEIAMLRAQNTAFQAAIARLQSKIEHQQDDSKEIGIEVGGEQPAETPED